MRFDEPDVREAYRLGARDCFEGVMPGLKPRKAREIERWLSELDAWQDGEHGDPPHPPVG